MADSPISPREAAETLRRMAAIGLAHSRTFPLDQWQRAHSERTADVWLLAALLVESIAPGDTAGVCRALEVLRLHQEASGAYLLRWLHRVAADYLRAALLTDVLHEGGIPPEAP